MKKYLILSFVTLFGIPQYTTAQDTAFHLQSSPANGALFTFTNNSPEIDTLKFDNGQFVRLRFENQTSTVAIDGRDIPVFNTILAIPEAENAPVIQIVAQSWVPVPTALPLSPTIQPQKDEELSRIAVVAPTSNLSELPVAAVKRTGWFRSLHVAHVQIVPVRYANGQLEYLQTAEFLLSWQISARQPQRLVSDKIDDPAALTIYRQLVLNPGNIEAFAKSRHRQLLKTTTRAGEEFLKIKVSRNGLYKLDGALLSGQGISLASIDPAQLRIYNNGGRPLPENPTATRPDSLIEIPVIVDTGGDGRFDATDAIYFYGRSVNDWEFSASQQRWQHSTSPYTTNNVYWLSWLQRAEPAKRLQPETISGATGEPATTDTRLQAIENEINNPIHSGRDWYGQLLNVGDSKTFTFQAKAASDKPATLYVRVVSETIGYHVVDVYWNSAQIGSIAFFGGSSGDYLYLIAREKSFPINGGLKAGANTVDLRYSSSTALGRVYVDWVELQHTDALAAENGALEFATAKGTGTAAFSLSGLGTGTKIFEISNPLQPRYLSFQSQSSALVFADSLSATTPRRYFATDAAITPDKAQLEKHTFSDLRVPQNSADLLIITHKDFAEQAERLAEHKRSVRSFEVKVIDIDTIIDEFGWGLLDPTAIRDFVSYAYHHWQKQPRYLLLVGDGHYDYRGIANKNPSFIPTYQTIELDELVSRNVEAYYTYVSGNDDDMDLAIGRLAVQTPDEAKIAVDKIIDYEANPEYGFWRTVVTMVADDELVRGGVGNETIHTRDADALAETDVPAYMNVRKIYLMEYRSVRTASISGVRKPDAQKAVISQINDGTLIINYVGHGNPQQWAHESVFVQAEDLPKIQNGKRLPFFIAATCDFGRFDNPKSSSFTEDLLNVEGRGAIAMVTSSRVVYASSNANFNRNYYRQLFASRQALRTVGDALVLARLFTSTLVNDEKYTILGDPSLILAVPKSIANVAQITPDSLFALGKTSLQGDTRDNANQRFNSTGAIELVAFDAPKHKTYVTAQNSTISYVLPGNLLFRGTGTVKEGGFNINFIAPKDITYGGSNARVSLYGFGNDWEAIGYRENIPISLRSNLLFDNQGPLISVNFAGRENFATGDPIPQQATLVATVVDTASGINLTGEIGHKITLTIDEDNESQLDLTAEFVYSPDNFLSGQLTSTMPELALGRHRAELKAWDNSNNSATAAFEFVVVEAGELSLNDVWNYPNPFNRSTTFTFILSDAATVKISIFTVGGRLVRTIDEIPAAAGFNQVPWDGLDAEGDLLANGIYLFRVVAKGFVDGNAKTASYIGKVAVRH